MTNEEIKSELTKLAAECFVHRTFPPFIVGDWKLPQSTSKTVRREIQSNLSQVDSSLRSIGSRLKKVIDSLPKTDAELGLKPLGESLANYQEANRRQ